MAIETKPRRQALPLSADTPPPPPHERGTDSPNPAPAPTPASPEAVGPSWVQFLGLQAAFVVAIGLLFGALALIVAAKSPVSAPAAAAPVAAAPSAVAAATPTVVPSATPAPVTAGRLPQPTVAAPVGQRAAQTVKVSLEAREVTGLLDEGIGYTYWTYGGTVPGPMIRVRQGDTVELTLTNAADSTTAHSIDLQAVNGPGGGSDVTLVAPGQAKTFRFQALAAGVFVYQSGSEPLPQQVSSGMYGLIVVEPPQGLPQVNCEYYAMQGELYLEGNRDQHGQRTYSATKAAAATPDYVVFNGAIGSLAGEKALRAQTGETVRLFFGVAGPGQESRLRLSGEIFDRVALQGTPLGDQSRWLTNVPGASVPVGGTAILEFVAEVPGRYRLTDEGLGHAAKGAIGEVVIEGAENPAIFTPQH